MSIDEFGDDNLRPTTSIEAISGIDRFKHVINRAINLIYYGCTLVNIFKSQDKSKCTVFSTGKWRQRGSTVLKSQSEIWFLGKKYVPFPVEGFLI